MDLIQRDPKLGEVRAILQRLQTFAAEPDSAALSSSELPTVGPEGETDRRPEGKAWALRSIARGRAITLTIAGACALLSATWLMISPSGHADLPPVPTLDVALKSPATDQGHASNGASTPRTTPRTSPRAAAEAAQDLLRKGRVQAARKQLLGLVSGDTPDVAWTLARSYDPNFLATIPAADAGPNVEQAARWYRAWLMAAVSQGLVPSTVSVERIIRAMR